MDGSTQNGGGQSHSFSLSFSFSVLCDLNFLGLELQGFVVVI
uniref:Uncharacterized protein n=1 Tax=Arundo donax TaxID=35708 RepID=A0A0A8Y442_ARUDO